MFRAKVFFEIFINGIPRQYEEITLLVNESERESALLKIKHCMQTKSGSFVNANSDMVEWMPMGIAELESYSDCDGIIEIDSRLMDAISPYALDRMLLKMRNLINE